MLELFLDSALYASVTLVLALNHREHGLLNLAAGTWIVLGGWIAACAGIIPAHSQLIDLRWPALFLPVLALVQMSSPLILGPVITSRPLYYLFVSLGVGVVAGVVASHYIPRFHGMSLPYPTSGASNVTFVVAALLSATVSTAMLQSRFFSRHVISSRQGNWRHTRKELAGLLCLEIVLLLLLGMASTARHKGVFFNAEMLAALPILALLASDGRLSYAATIAFSIVFVSGILDRTGQLAGASLPLLVIALAFVVIFQKFPGFPVLQARRNDWLPNVLTDRRGLQASAITALGIFIGVGASGVALLGADHAPLQSFFFLSLLTVIAWLGIQQLGVLTIGWPTFCVAAAYTVTGSGDHILKIVALLAIAVSVWVAMLFILRILPLTSAILVDLALVIAANHFIASDAAISGSENFRAVPHWLSFTSRQDFVLNVCGLLITIAFAASLVSYWRGSWNMQIGISNFALGRLHGMPVVRWWASLAIFASVVAVLGSVVFYGGRGGVSPQYASVHVGLSVLLLAYAGAIFDVLLTALGAVLLFMFLPIMLSGHGVFVEMAVGVALVLTAMTGRFQQLSSAGHLEHGASDGH